MRKGRWPGRAFLLPALALLAGGCLPGGGAPIRHSSLSSPVSFPREHERSSLGAPVSAVGHVLDRIVIGDSSSEALHGFEGTNVTEPQVNAVNGAVFRRIGPHGTERSPGAPLPPAGLLRFTLRCDPDRQNYLTVRFWGSDGEVATFFLYGADEDRISGHGELLWNEHAGAPGKFFAVTYPIPTRRTEGEKAVTLAVGAIGALSPYAADPAHRELLLGTRSPGVYEAIMSTDPFVDLEGGHPPQAPPTVPPTPVAPALALTGLRAALDKSLHFAKTWQIFGPHWRTQVDLGNVPRAVYGAPMVSLGPDQVSDPRGWLDTIADQGPRYNLVASNILAVFARAFVSPWSAGHRDPELLDRVTAALDYFCRAQGANGSLGTHGERGGWVGGPTRRNGGFPLEGYGDYALGEAFLLLEADLSRGIRLEELIDHDNNPATPGIPRRAAWTDMFAGLVRFLRSPEGRGHAPNQDLQQQIAMWLANEVVRRLAPGRAVPREAALASVRHAVGLLPDPYGGLWISPGGIALEPNGTGDGGYDFNYGTTCVGQVNHLAVLTDDPEVWKVADRMTGAMSRFVYASRDATGRPVMRGEGQVAYRNLYWPCPEYYGEEFTQAAVRGNPVALRATQLALAQGSFPGLREGSIHYLPTVAATWRALPDIERVVEQVGGEHPPSLPRLPGEEGVADFAWGDPVAGAVVVRDGEARLFVSLNWRRGWRDGVRDSAHRQANDVARAHYVTPRHEQVATFAMESTGFGERYTTQFGPYRIVQNLSEDLAYPLLVPSNWRSVRDLVSGAVLDFAAETTIGPLTTMVLVSKGARGDDDGAGSHATAPAPPR